MRTLVPTAFALLLVFQPGLSHAQAASVQPGGLIRVVFARGAQPQTYSVLEVRGDTIRARAEATGREEPIVTSDLHRLQVRQGSRSRSETFLRRAGIGAVIGAAVIGTLVAATDDDDFFGDSPAAKFGVGAIGGAAVGGAIGAVAGLAGAAGDRGVWVEVPLR